jgi:hypothetical protein
MYKTPLIAHANADTDATKGHGLGSTKWNGCRCKIFDVVDNKVMIYLWFELCFLILCTNDVNNLTTWLNNKELLLKRTKKKISNKKICKNDNFIIIHLAYLKLKLHNFLKVQLPLQ